MFRRKHPKCPDPSWAGKRLPSTSAKHTRVNLRQQRHWSSQYLGVFQVNQRSSKNSKQCITKILISEESSKIALFYPISRFLPYSVTLSALDIYKICVRLTEIESQGLEENRMTQRFLLSFLCEISRKVFFSAGRRWSLPSAKPTAGTLPGVV